MNLEQKKILGLTLLITLLLFIPFITKWLGYNELISDSFKKIGSQQASVIQSGERFIYIFSVDGILNESGEMENTTSPYWWLNSGGQLILKDGVGMTIQERLPALHRWQIAYSISNPGDTLGGYYPQNIFRLLTRSTTENPSVEVTFQINDSNYSNSPNRNQSNGVLLMSRYLDSESLYYAGVRVDGTAVIKKKYQGTYHTLAQQKIFEGIYDREESFNLLPTAEWIGLKSETTTLPNGDVEINLYMKRFGQNSWQQILTTTDKNGLFRGTPVIPDAGHVGIRTDFMDVSFRNFRLEAM